MYLKPVLFLYVLLCVAKINRVNSTSKTALLLNLFTELGRLIKTIDGGILKALSQVTGSFLMVELIDILLVPEMLSYCKTRLTFHAIRTVQKYPEKPEFG